MKKLLVVMMAVMAITGLMAGSALAVPNDKLIVKDAAGSATVFVVRDDGTVGIGTPTPDANLKVDGTLFPSSKVRRTVSFTNGGRGVAAFELKSTGDMVDGFGPSFEFWISDNTFTATKGIVTMEALRDGSDDSGKWLLRTANAGTLGARVAVDKLGNVGIGVVAPSFPLQMASGAFVTVGGVWTNASSREFKDNIQDLSSGDAMKTLEGLNPVTFTYKADVSDHHVGFIAEDVPQLVATKDRKGLSPMDIVAVLTKVVQEQQKTIADLTEKLNLLEGKVSKINSKDVVGRLSVE